MSVFTFLDEYKHVTCPICLEPWRNPVEFQPCRHVFCSRCAERLETCAECRADVAGRNPANRILANMAHDIRVKCEACGWEGRHADSPSHDCPNAQGGGGMERQPSAIHIDEEAEFMSDLISIRSMGSVAICIKDFAATVPLTKTISSKEDNECCFRVVNDKGGKIVIGLVDADDRHIYANAAIGRRGYANALGLTAEGKVISNGRAIDSCTGFKPGDLVKVRLHDGHVSFNVNGKDVSERVKQLTFNGEFRFGVSLTQCGQCVAIGRGEVDELVTAQLDAALEEVRNEAPLRLRDCLRSIDCNGQDTTAFCVKNLGATVHSQVPFDAQKDLHVTFQVLGCPEDKKMLLGLIPDEDLGEYHRAIMGSPVMAQSVALSTDGEFVTPAGNKQTSARLTEGCELDMRISNGTVKFEMGGEVVAESPISGMNWLGLSLTAVGQAVRIVRKDGVVPNDDSADFVQSKAEMLATIGERFEDNMRSIDCDPQEIVAVAVKDFPATLHCRETFSATETREVAFHIVASKQGFPIRVGVLEGSCEGHSNSVLGKMEGSVGYLARGVLVHNGEETKEEGLKSFGPGDKVTVIVDKGVVNFRVNDGDLVLKDGAPVSGQLRFGVTLPTMGQSVSVGQRPDHADDFVKRKVHEASMNNDRFRDNMRSVDCDGEDKTAICVKEFNSTSYIQSVVNSSDSTTQTFRVMRLPEGSRMVLGIIVEQAENHANQVLGASQLRGAMGLWNDGDIIVEGNTVDQTRGFKEGDLVTVGLKQDKVSFLVNGESVSEQCSHLTLKGRFRYAASLPSVGVAVYAGENPPDSAKQWVEQVVSKLEGVRRWKDNMRSVDCDNDDVVAVCVKDFNATLHEQQAHKATASATFHVMRRGETGTMAFGIMDANTDRHAETVLGQSELRHSVGYDQDGLIQCGGEILDDGPKLKDGDKVTVEVTPAHIRFTINDTHHQDVPNEHHKTAPFRFAASLTQRGQIACIADEVPESGLAWAENVLSTGSTSDKMRFEDNLRSIDCCGQDFGAVCTSSRPATVHLQSIHPTDDATVTCHFRIMNLPPMSVMSIGVIDMASGDAHADSVIGDKKLRRAVGLASMGKIVGSGKVLGNGKTFEAGDVVSVSIESKHATFKVNNEQVGEPVALKADAVRFAVSLPTEHQAVCIQQSLEENMHPTTMEFFRNRLADSSDDDDADAASSSSSD